MCFLRNFVLSRFSLKLIAAVFLSISLTSGCSNTQDPPKWELCESLQTKQSTTKTEVPATDHLVVYIDTSASMAGYVSPDGGKSFAISPDGQTIFSKTLLELRNVVTTLSPQPAIAVRKVDTAVSAPSFSDLELSQAAFSRGTFNGKETNIAGAIKNFSQPLSDDEEIKNPPRFHIFVTDGVQSSNKQSVDTSCAQGSDPVCVKKQILELLNNGWSATVIGLRSEFQGNVFSEIQKKAVPFATKKDASQFRPFFLYVFSPNKTALDQLTVKLRQRLGELVKDGNSLREYALTSDYAGGIATVEIQNTSKDFLDVRQEKEKEGNLPRITVKADVDTASAGGKPFLLKVKIPWSENARLGGTGDEMSGLVKWTLEAIGGDKEAKGIRYPNLKLVKQEAKDGGAELTFEAGWTLEAGDLGWRIYRLNGKLDTEKNAPSWVRAWSTDDDARTENGNRTLNLESSLGTLWNNASLQNYAVASACIRVGEK
jgi:hypothetical protein